MTAEFTVELTAEELARLSNANDRYEVAAHAIQAGTKMRFRKDTGEMSVEQMVDDDKSVTSMPLLRTGIDLSKVEQAGLATLLMRKGVFTIVEYVEALAEAAENEKLHLEEEISAAYGGARVTLV